jgi:hypothetical protein
MPDNSRMGLQMPESPITFPASVVKHFGLAKEAPLTTVRGLCSRLECFYGRVLSSDSRHWVPAQA